MSFIQARGLRKSFGRHKVLDGVDLDIKKQSSLVIIGRSGTGKSVLIKTLIGIIKPDSGRVKINGVDFYDATKDEKKNIIDNLGFLFQGGAIFDSLNVEDNITFSVNREQNLTQDQKSDLAVENLEAVGLSSKVLKLMPSELSGGMLKRVALARAICGKPKIIMFDEPTTGLDPIMSNVINDLIMQIRKNLKATTITISHDMNSVRQIATDVIMLDEGKIVWQGTAQEMEEADEEHVDQFIHGKLEGPMSLI